ncbi:MULTISPECIES: hypothetical protein [unclassified Lentimonas]|uniref:hypothetical protein n=1 Tax=unclassified Lentimonas TaxID=2630993 RepID=UPI00132153BD|nr:MULTISPECIES: hypothetical protein [unclassified Lentimonas]CAA6692612.1 Unannotated [Lentimonas sp. CC19]CAA6696963.1 Unannotated [Lentimonas sp. CC10]CAA7070992.1 Unannotated [Lentimonas sp. CC11]
MAITLEANYSKKLGLPQYSSHQYSITVRTELSDLSKVEAASAHLYQQLQDAVDREIQNPGFLPGDEGQSRQVVPFDRGGASAPAQSNHASPTAAWNCSEKQQGLIIKIIKENNLSFESVDELAHNRFNCGLKNLNKMSASGLIDELFDTYRKQPKGRSNAPGAYQGGRR